MTPDSLTEIRNRHMPIMIDEQGTEICEACSAASGIGTVGWPCDVHLVLDHFAELLGKRIGP